MTVQTFKDALAQAADLPGPGGDAYLKRSRVLALTETHLQEMTVERAREITSACVQNFFSRQGILPEHHPLPDCSLEEMLIANRIVSGPAGTIKTPDGASRVLVHVDPRGIAAAYALQHYGGQPIALLEALGFTLGDPGEDDDEPESDEEGVPA